MNKTEYQRQWNDIYDIHSKNNYIELPWINNDNLSDFKSLIDSLELGVNPSIIDIGCGIGQIANLLSQKGNVYAIDVSNNEIERCRNRYKHNKNITFENKNILDINVKQKYDLVVAHLLLHEIQPEHIDVVCQNIASLVAKNGYLLLSWLKQDFDYAESVRPCLYAQEKFYVHYYKKQDIKNKFPFFCTKDYPDVKIKTSDIVLGHARMRNVKGFTYQTLLMQMDVEEISIQKLYRIIINGFSTLNADIKLRNITSECQLETISKSIFESLSISIFRYLSLNGNIRNANVFLNLQVEDTFTNIRKSNELLFSSLNRLIDQSVIFNHESRANVLVGNYHKYFNESNTKQSYVKFLIHDFFDKSNNDENTGDVKLLDLYLNDEKIFIKRRFYDKNMNEQDVCLSVFLNRLNYKNGYKYNIDKYIEYAELLFNHIGSYNRFSKWLKDKKINIPIDIPKHYTVWNLSFPFYNYIGTIIIESFEDNEYSKIPNDSLNEIRNVFHAFKIEFQKAENELAKFRIQTEAIKSAKAAIMSRNMSHNLGSHYIANTKNYISNLANVKNDKDLRGLTHLLQYIQERMDYIATVISNDVYPLGSLNVKSQIFDELTIDDCGARHGEKHETTNFLLKYIVFSEKYSRVDNNKSGLKNLRIEINYPSPNNPDKERIFTGKDRLKETERNLKLELSKLNVAVPGGIMARHALFNIIENIIRNSAKHNKENCDNELVIRITLERAQASSNLKISIHDNRGAYDSLIKGENKDKKSYVADRLKELRFLEQDGSLNKENKGLKEMIISALWLKNEDIGEIMAEIDREEDGDKKYELIIKKCLQIERTKAGDLAYVVSLPIFQEVMQIPENFTPDGLKNVFADIIVGKEEGSNKFEKRFNRIFPRYLIENNVNQKNNVEKLKQAIYNNLGVSVDDYQIRIDKSIETAAYENIVGVVNTLPETTEIKPTQICFITHFDIKNDSLKKNELDKYKNVAYLDSISGENFTSTLITPEFLKDDYLRCKIVESALTKIAVIDERIYEKFSRSEKMEQQSLRSKLKSEVEKDNIRTVSNLLNHLDDYYSSAFGEEKQTIRESLKEEEKEKRLEENSIDAAIDILCPENIPQRVLSKRGIFVYTIEQNANNKSVIKEMSGAETMLGDGTVLQDVHFLSIHLGLVEKYKNGDGVASLMKDIQKHFGNVKYISIHSGRGNYSAELKQDLKDYCFITLSALEAAINNSKYMLSQLFYNMNYYGKGNINND